MGPAFTLSPECDIIVHQFNFNPLWLTPSVLLNFRVSAFFIGAGISKFFLIGSGYTLSSDILFKANAGIKVDNVKAQAYLYTPFDAFFEDFGIGFNLGFGF